MYIFTNHAALLFIHAYRLTTEPIFPVMISRNSPSNDIQSTDPSNLLNSTLLFPIVFWNQLSSGIKCSKALA